MEEAPEQAAARERFRSFVSDAIAPQAAAWDAAGQLPASLPATLAEARLLAQAVPAAYGGAGADPLTYGLLHAEIGAVCASTRALLTVHDMVATAIARWGDEAQKNHWLPALAAGRVLGAFALTEPEAGSDARSIGATARLVGEEFRLDGRKQWITAGRMAGLFLVFARLDGKPSAFLVSASAPGLSVRDMPPPLGLRAAMPAELEFSDCRIPTQALLGRAGMGLSHVAATALHLGRYAVAWGCAGMQQACLCEAVGHARSRVQFGAALREHQLVQEMIAEMAVELRASVLLCKEAGHLRQTGDPEAVIAVAIAKTYAAGAAQRASLRAVQILGARGCGPASPAQRHFRDAKVMEIIEGSTQIQQLLIAADALQRFADPRRGTS
ncbi:MAG: acyl-CoA dehydrogenase family protein [Candidatus Eisenbacteria bacterium]